MTSKNLLDPSLPLGSSIKRMYAIDNANKDVYVDPTALKEFLDVTLKLDKTAVKQVTGVSTTDVMSQKAVTDALALKISTANATVELNKKIDKTAVKQVTGTSTTDVMSQKAVTDAASLKIDKTAVKQVTGVSTTDVMSQKAVNDELSAVDYRLLPLEDELIAASVTWDMVADVYTGTPRATRVHQSMRRCCLLADGTVNYYLDEFNSALKEDGTASVLDGSDGQVMVEISRAYIRTSRNDDKVTYELASLPLAGFSLHPAFHGGVEKIYIGAYQATVFSAATSTVINGLNSDNNSARVDLTLDKLYSGAGNYAMVGLNRDNFRQMARNNDCQVFDYYQWQLLQYLFVTEYGNFNSQVALGNGNVSRAYLESSDVQADSPHTINGVSDSFGNYSASVGGAVDPFVSYRGIEHLWGNAQQYIDGVNIDALQVYASNNEDTYADNTNTGDYTALGVPLPTPSNWIKSWQALNDVFLPATGGASSTTFIGDQLYVSDTGFRVMAIGGNAHNGSHAGVSCCNGNHSSSNRGRSVSARLSKKLHTLS